MLFQEWDLTTNIAAPFQYRARSHKLKKVAAHVHKQPSVGRVIQRERMSRYWTLEVLSNKTGISVANLKTYESDCLVPCASVLEALTKVFNVDIK